jgi:hypothetical protein
MQKAKVQKKPVSLIVLLAALAAGGQAGAASQNITASIGFDTPLTLIKR